MLYPHGALCTNMGDTNLYIYYSREDKSMSLLDMDAS